MSPVTKRLSVCPNYNCRNFVGNKMSHPINHKYRPLLGFSCVKCNEQWLVCYQHEKKFCRRRYHDAYKHIQSISHESFPLVISESVYCFPIMKIQQMKRFVLLKILKCHQTISYYHQPTFLKLSIHNSMPHHLIISSVILANAFSSQKEKLLY